MTFRSMGVLIVFLVSLLFVVVNWGPIMTPMPISFILFTVNAPLGLFLIVGSTGFRGLSPLDALETGDNAGRPAEGKPRSENRPRRG